jgi:voltage-gated potassium channel
MKMRENSADGPTEPSDPARTLGPLRDGINALFRRYELPWTLFMAVLALLYVGLGTIEEQARPILAPSLVDLTLNLITALFVTEFLMRLYAAPSRWHYVKRHWFDLLAVLPSLRFLRLLGLARLAILLRLLRIVRLGVITRSLIDANRAAGRLQWIGKRNGVQTLLLTAFGLVWVGAGLTYEFEHGVNPDFANFGDSVWWAFTTMATLGHGNGPATVPGRVVAALLMVLGIACFGLITATVTTFIMQRTEQVAEYTTGDLMAAMKEMQTRMSRLEDELVRRRSD